MMEIYRKKLLKSAFLLALLSVVSACSSDSDSSDSDSSDTDTSVTDEAPTVDAGSDQTVTEGDTVTLTATVSDDGSYTVTWAQTDGDTTISLSDTDSETVSFTAPDVDSDETYSFEVTVDDGVNDAVSDTVTVTVEDESSDDDSSTDDSVWIINESGELSEHILDSSTGIGVEVNVQSVSYETVDSEEYVVVNSQGIPNYEFTVTDDILDTLNSRPKADTDFLTGAATVEVGDTVAFGEDIGYDSNSNCTDDYGYGYWPPGPECPTEDERTVYLPTEPTDTTEECESGLSKIGIMVNGTSIYNWGDGFTYTSDGYWANLAPRAEIYDVDVCGGHAAGTDYHHHLYSSCLAELLGDDGSAHSPLWGYAADGYPIYGPWEGDGELAISSWVTRDYDDETIGCSDGERSCILVDQYDYTQGTEEVTSGPGFDDTVTSLSDNEFIAENGFYLEDYYWDSSLTELGGAYLDQHNGHTDDEHGYHYHITISVNDEGSYEASFPYIIGPRYAGELRDNAVASCSTSNDGPGF
jgi:hypothetical protein